MSMAAREQRIILKAGFSIYRLNLVGKSIWRCKSPGGWTIHSRHETQAATNRAWKELMKDKTRISG